MASPHHRNLRRFLLSVLSMYSVSTSFLYTLQVSHGTTSIHSEVMLNARLARPGRLGRQGHDPTGLKRIGDSRSLARSIYH